MIKTGVIRTYYDNEEKILKEEYFIFNGKKEGIYRLYFENGRIYKEINYIDDKISGICRVFYNKGNLLIEAFYKDGINIYGE